MLHVLEIMVMFNLKLLFNYTSTVSVCLWLSMARMETDCNLIKLIANIDKLVNWCVKS